MFPAEGVALLPIALALSDPPRWPLRLLLIAVICAVIVFLRAVATRPVGGGRPDWVAVVISLISFLLYAASMKAFGLMGSPQEHALWVIFLTIVWLALISVFPNERLRGN
jgi:hypothetical protein